MTERSQPRMDQATRQRFVENRNLERTAPARCACYAIFSDLTASPHEVEARAATGDNTDILDDLPFSFTVQSLLDEQCSMESDRLKLEFSALFEVGSDGPPVPIREDLQLGQPAGLREDIVRFYDFFKYGLEEKFAWAPDHLSVELEFMHYLCYQEASRTDDRLSYQLAQVDFSERHLYNWVPQLVSAVTKLQPDSFYCRVVTALSEFVSMDYAWQLSTVAETGEGIDDVD